MRHYSSTQEGYNKSRFVACVSLRIVVNLQVCFEDESIGNIFLIWHHLHLSMNEDEGSRLDRGGHPRVIRVRLVLTLKLEQLICAGLHHLSETKTR